MTSGSAKKVVLTALSVNFLIALAKFGGAIFTGSAAMFSEAIHSTIDSGNQILLLYGLRCSKRAPDAKHPFGYGREIYFWSFMVAVILFTAGAIFAFREGIAQITHPSALESVAWNFPILALAMLLELHAFHVAWKVFQEKCDVSDIGFIAALRRSKDPLIFVVLLEDLAALIGLAIAFGGLLLSLYFNDPVFDGYASLLIGCVLAVVAIFMSIEIKALLIGEAAHPELIAQIRNLVHAQDGVVKIHKIDSMQMSPDKIMLTLQIALDPEMPSQQLQESFKSLGQTIRDRHREIHKLFIEI